uniref:Putative secreted protein n=1 Tax=Anopheles darlingi TaxID=43151 RepID=A0A2M4DJR4_ANODA
MAPGGSSSSWGVATFCTLIISRLRCRQTDARDDATLMNVRHSSGLMAAPPHHIRTNGQKCVIYVVIKAK